MDILKWTTSKIRALKNQGPFACLTAYDFSSARLIDQIGIPLILVGDSLAMTILGHENTLTVNMNMMLHHTTAVARGVKNALVVGDMPFLSYQISISEAIRNAGLFIQQAGADAVKIEGGKLRSATVKALTENGIPVLGHIGLTPQNVLETGGYKIQGRTSKQVEQLKNDATALEEAGVFALVLECLPPETGRAITESVGIPTIGIGAGPYCDGQILVIQDLLGISGNVAPKFVKRYADIDTAMIQAFKTYKGEVERGEFPGKEHCYGDGAS